MLVGILSIVRHCAVWQFDNALTSEDLHHVVKVLEGEGFGPYTKDERKAIVTIVWKESSNRPWARNRNSTAYGLFGGLKGTYKNYGFEWGDPCAICQTRFGLTYIKKRYGSPVNALEFHNRKGWY